jgi:hypothetical protein
MSPQLQDWYIHSQQRDLRSFIEAGRTVSMRVAFIYMIYCLIFHTSHVASNPTSEKDDQPFSVLFLHISHLQRLNYSLSPCYEWTI